MPLYGGLLKTRGLKCRLLNVSFGGGYPAYPSLMPSFEWNLLMRWHKIFSQETRDYHMVKKTSSLSHLELVWYWVVMDRENCDS